MVVDEIIDAVAGGVAADGLAGGGCQQVAAGNVGITARAVASPIAVFIIAQGLGFDRGRLAAETVQRIIGIVGGAAAVDALADVAVGVIGEDNRRVSGGGIELAGAASSRRPTISNRARCLPCCWP